MTKLIKPILFLVLISSCKKESPSLSDKSVDNILVNARVYLKDNTSAADFDNLEWRGTDLVPFGGNIYAFRIPFKGKSIANDFILLQTDSDGDFVGGRIVHLDQTGQTSFQFDGSITISSLKRATLIASPIRNGYISAYHSEHSGQVSVNSTPTSPSSDPLSPYVVPASAGSDLLPEVVVMGYLSGAGSVSLSTYMRLITLMASNPNGGDASPGSGGGTGGGSAGGAYGAVPVTGSPNSPNTSGNATNLFAPSIPNGGGIQGPSVTTPIAIEPDYLVNQSIVNIADLMRCFDNIPSAGASYSISLCSDLPVNSNPAYVTLGTESGHAFITLTKSNAGQTITQSFGFYPAVSPSILDPFGTIIGGIKDNGNHEINARISMSVSESQFNSLKNVAIQQSSNNYTLSGFNCTAYALTVFNSVRTQPITTSPLIVYLPANTSIYNPTQNPQTVSILYSPQGLFSKLQQMKSSSTVDASNIIIDQTDHTLSPTSHGSCK